MIFSPPRACSCEARDCEHRLEIELHGELDVVTGPRLVALLDAALAAPGIHAVRISAQHLRAVDRDGASVLIDACRRAASSGRHVAVVDPPAALLRLTGRSGTNELLGLKSEASASQRRTTADQRAGSATQLTTKEKAFDVASGDRPRRCLR